MLQTEKIAYYGWKADMPHGVIVEGIIKGVSLADHQEAILPVPVTTPVGSFWATIRRLYRRLFGSVPMPSPILYRTVPQLKFCQIEGIRLDGKQHDGDGTIVNASLPVVVEDEQKICDIATRRGIAIRGASFDVRARFYGNGQLYVELLDIVKPERMPFRGPTRREKRRMKRQQAAQRMELEEIIR